MNTRHSAVKPAYALQVGDIVNISNVALGFGYRYHRVLSTPKPDGSQRFLDRVTFNLGVVGHTVAELRNGEPFNWNLHVHRDTPMRVLLKAPRSNHRQ